jgi:hypothetical protein
MMIPRMMKPVQAAILMRLMTNSTCCSQCVVQPLRLLVVHTSPYPFTPKNWMMTSRRSKGTIQAALLMSCDPFQ